MGRLQQMNNFDESTLPLMPTSTAPRNKDHMNQEIKQCIVRVKIMARSMQQSTLLKDLDYYQT
jgi:hypothetical protein